MTNQIANSSFRHSHRPPTVDPVAKMKFESLENTTVAPSLQLLEARHQHQQAMARASIPSSAPLAAQPMAAVVPMGLDAAQHQPERPISLGLPVRAAEAEHPILSSSAPIPPREVIADDGRLERDWEVLEQSTRIAQLRQATLSVQHTKLAWDRHRSGFAQPSSDPELESAEVAIDMAADRPLPPSDQRQMAAPVSSSSIPHGYEPAAVYRRIGAGRDAVVQDAIMRDPETGGWEAVQIVRVSRPSNATYETRTAESGGLQRPDSRVDAPQPHRRTVASSSATDTRAPHPLLNADRSVAGVSGAPQQRGAAERYPHRGARVRRGASNLRNVMSMTGASQPSAPLLEPRAAAHGQIQPMVAQAVPGQQLMTVLPGPQYHTAHPSSAHQAHSYSMVPPAGMAQQQAASAAMSVLSPPVDQEAYWRAAAPYGQSHQVVASTPMPPPQPGVAARFTISPDAIHLGEHAYQGARMILQVRPDLPWLMPLPNRGQSRPAVHHGPHWVPGFAPPGLVIQIGQPGLGPS
jgi:hypothetical protein